MNEAIEFLTALTAIPGASDLRFKSDTRTGLIRVLVHARGNRVVVTTPESLDNRWMELTSFLLPDRPEMLGIHEHEDFVDVPKRVGDDSMRFRASLTSNTRGETLVLRVLPSAIPTPAKIMLPDDLVKRFIAMDDGLFLFVGQTGSGKSTSIAALVKARAEQRAQSVVTLEDPVEYLYPSTVGESDFDQRQVRKNTGSFASGLKAAMRMAPDVIQVGEIRDAEGASTALSAAMSGHLVVGTMHATFAFQGPQRLFSFINNDGTGMGGQVGLEVVSGALKGVVAQRLLRNKNDGKLVAVHEILMVTSAVAQKITSGDFKSLKLEIETGAKDGMQTFEQAIKKAISKGLLPPNTQGIS